MSRRSEHTTKVFVGSLPPNVTVEDLRQLFAPFGEIAECDIANRCGFLHLENKELAAKAIEELNNTTFMGGRISVEKGRVKPRGERRMRNSRGGGEGPRGRRRDSGPYSRDGGYMRGGPPRNGGYDQSDYGYGGDYRGDYPPRGGYDDGYDRRPPMYDDRRGGGGYMGGERRPYNNGYDRRGGYDDRGGYPEPPRPSYDDRRMPPSGPTGGYDDRRPPISDRRPLIDDQGMGQGSMRPPLNSYDRAPPGNDMYSRRESVNKPLTGGYDRQQSQGSYGGSYGSTAATGYPPSQSSGYGAAPVNTGYTQQAASSYGDNRGASGGYMDTRQAAPVPSGGYSTQQASGSYSSAPSGGYGDNYGMRSNSGAYDTAYPPLPQQRGW